MEVVHRAALQKAYLFQDISDNDFTVLISCLSPKVKHFSKNEIVILTGESVNHIGIVLAGTAGAYLEHVDGSQTLISNLTPKSVFGEVLVSTRTQKSPVTVHAVTDLTVVFIEYQQVYSECASACPAHRLFLQNMIKAIGDKYFHLFDRIAILREKTLRSKIIAYLCSLNDATEATTVRIPFTKTVLADYLLANRSALSKELRNMERDGLIAVDGRKVDLIFRSTDKANSV